MARGWDASGDYGYLWAWESLAPADVAGVMREFSAPWWICDGVALDLFVGRETRRHAPEARRPPTPCRHPSRSHRRIHRLIPAATPGSLPGPASATFEYGSHGPVWTLAQTATLTP
jgi:hypothetical protein